MHFDGIAPDLNLFGNVVLRHTVGVGAVAEDFARFGAKAGQNGEIQHEIAFLPVGDGTDIPFIPFLTGDDEIFTNFAVQHHGLIPSGGYTGDELGAFVLLQVIAWTVA